jgi:MarR family transcriptional regulator, 2-MHQ and catechol-resistance regulon repressor
MPQRSSSSKTERRALSAYVKLLRASDTVHALATRDLSRWDLTASQFAVMEALYHLGPMVLSKVARKILKTGGNLTMVVRNLERRGLVQRVTGEKDRRFVKLSLTDKGNRLIAEVFPKHAACIAGLLAKLTPAEQVEIAALCRKLGRALATADPSLRS